MQEAEQAFRMLLEEGFDRRAAADILDKSSPEQVLRQLRWAAKRKASKNRLGLLRRAIEEDWPEPQGISDSDFRVSDLPGEGTFAEAFYAAWSGRGGESAAVASAGDLTAARRLLARLGPEKDAAGWGSAFGGFVSQKTRQAPYHRLPKSLVIACRELGDLFLGSLQQQARQTRASDREAARQAHEAAYQEEWLAYVEDRWQEIAEEEPEAMKAYEEEERRQRRGVLKFTARLVPGAVEQFDSQEERLRRFAEFFRENRAAPVLDFWAWDAKLNRKHFAD